MQDPKRVSQILHQVVQAVDVPVTLKTRTGWANKHRNIMTIAKIAEQAGIASLVIHGRTREQAYTGHAEYENIRRVKQAIAIPVIANGDISDAKTARFILDYTGVDGLMLGRITQGQPWIFQQINASLYTENPLETDVTPPGFIPLEQKINTLLAHIHAIHRFYGADQGVRIARKHIGWYLYSLTGHMPQQFLKNVKQMKKTLFLISSANEQIESLSAILNLLSSQCLQESFQKHMQHDEQGNTNLTQRIKAA